MGVLPDDHGPGTAGALLTTSQYLSGAVTIAVLTLVLGQSRGYAAFTSTFVILAAAAGAGALLGIRRRPAGRATG